MFPKFAKSRFQEEFLSLTEKVGHHPVTPFERRVLPLAFGGRDLAVEIPKGEDITAAMVLAGLPSVTERPGENVSVVLTSNPDSVKKIGQKLRTVAARWDKNAYTVSIGGDENIKKELQLLSRPPDIIVGTPERLIDHIRRENLSVAKVRKVIIALPDDCEETGFDKDLLFIYSKLSNKTQTILFTSSMEEPLPSILKRPQILQGSGEPAKSPSFLVYQASDVEEKPKLLGDIFYAEEVEDCAVVCRTKATAERLVAELAAQGIAARQLSGKGPVVDPAICETELKAKTIRAIVTDSLRVASRIQTLKRVIFYEIPSDANSHSELGAQLSEFASCSPLISIIAGNEQGAFEGTQEVQYVDTSKSPSNDDILKGKIRSIVKKIKEDADPDELNRLRKIVRRNVPFFLRGYFMAYLIKETPGRRELTEEMKTLFVSIGKNRRVFPRDLSRLFTGTLDIQAGSLGNIKVLDNYSFIDIPETLAERAISMLDGKDFRGRKITVNHARKKDEE